MTTLLQADGSWNTNAGTADGGKWRITATVVDPAGNAGTASQVLTRDTDPPDTRITDTTAPGSRITGQSRNRKTSKVTFRFVSSEKGSTFSCKIDRKAWATCASPKKFKAGRGAHTFRVRAIDAAGNVDKTPATRRFRVR